MEKQLIRRAALSLALVVGMSQALPGYCCGPFFPVGIYSYWNHPDLPLRKFAEGNVGIIQPSLANSYLIVAYRYFTGRPLDQSEQSAVVNLWHQRLNLIPDSIDPKDWFAVRNTVPGAKKMESKDFVTYADQVGNYRSYQNCSQPALQTAARTLKSRIAKYGINSTEVKRWVDNQDIVFSNCGGQKTGSASLPQDPGPGADKLCKQDFAYQIAAATFYGGDLDSAEKQFEKIASDTDSPWRQLSAYLQARTAVRRITMKEYASGTATPADDAQAIAAAAFVERLLADKSLGEVHDDLQDLLNQLNYRLHPTEEYERLAGAVLQPHSGRTLQSDLDDYTTILPYMCPKPDSTSSDSAAPKAEANSAQASATTQIYGIPAECLKQDITDWLYGLGADTPADKAHVIGKWKSTKSIPWLIAALVTAKATDSDTDELIKEAQSVPANSPAYLSAQYYSIRLLADKGKKENARQSLDQILASKSLTIPPSSRNVLLALRQTVARNLAECIGFGLKQPVSEVIDPSDATLPDDFDKVEKQVQYQKPLPASFDERMCETLNAQLPLSGWNTLSHDNRLSAKQHNEVVEATWMRALLLDNDNLALELTPMLEKSYPYLRAMLSSFQSARTPSERRFAACYVMLKAPGLSPYIRGGLGRFYHDLRERDDFGDNFWVPPNPDEKKKDADPIDETGSGDPSLLKPELSKLLTAQQLNEALKEKRTMYTAASPARYITETVIAWSKERPNDPRIPEALFRAIKMPRWGCRVPGSTDYSKAAFTRLHAKYPTTSWAAEAQYYY